MTTPFKLDSKVFRSLIFTLDIYCLVNGSLVYANSWTTAGLISAQMAPTVIQVLASVRERIYCIQKIRLINSKSHKMKNKRSVLMPAVIEQWGRWKISIIIKTNPSHLACFPRNSSPVTVLECNTETTVDVEIFLQGACNGSSVKFRASCQRRRQTGGHCSLGAALLLNISHPNTPSARTLPELSEETDSGWHHLSSRKFVGYLLR